MGIMHGLAVFFIIFELIIIQSEGFSNVPPLTPKLIGKIISKAGFDTVRRAIRAKAIKTPDIDEDELFESRIVLITPYQFDGRTTEIERDGERFLVFSSYGVLLSFFGSLGQHIKKIEIRSNLGGGGPIGDKNPYLFAKCADSLEELRVSSPYDDKICNALEGVDTIFPNVRKFVYNGPSEYIKFKLGVIFPSLETVKLIGSLEDSKCFEDVTTLIEFDLSECVTIQEDQLKAILANNENIRNISLSGLNTMMILDLIANHLTKLDSLNVHNPGRNVLFRDDNERESYFLMSVTHFSVHFEVIEELLGHLPFDMPNLKRLELHGGQAQNIVIYFIHDFEKLECVEFFIESGGFGQSVKDIKMNFDLTVWTLSREKHYGSGEIYLKFERQP